MSSMVNNGRANSYPKKWNLRKIPTTDFLKHLHRDEMLSTMKQSVYMLQMLCMFPEKHNFWIQVFNTFIHINFIILFVLNALYFFLNLNDLEIIAAAMPPFCSLLISLVKGVSLMVSRTKLNKALYILWKDFWPSTHLSPRERDEVIFNSKVAKTYIGKFPYISISVTMLMVAPSILYNQEQRQFAIELFLPPSFKYATPYYEIIAVWECIMFPIGIWYCLAYDFMYIAIVNNVATQFRLLKHSLSRMCSDDPFPIFDQSYQRASTPSESELLCFYIRRHNLLLEYSKELDSVFTFVALAQFSISLMGTCISAVLYTVHHSMVMLPYCFVAILELFMYCYPANELKLASVKLADGISDCAWYMSKNNQFKKSLIPMIVRAQREVSLSVGHFFQMDFVNFVNVLKTSFSFYTLISTFLEKDVVHR